MEILIKLLLLIVFGFVLQPPLVMSSYVKGKVRLQVPWPLSFVCVLLLELRITKLVFYLAW